MGAYVIRYTNEDGTFYHNALTLEQNRHEMAGGVMAPALVILDREIATVIAKGYQKHCSAVEILECRQAVGTMTYYGPADSM